MKACTSASVRGTQGSPGRKSIVGSWRRRSVLSAVCAGNGSTGIMMPARGVCGYLFVR
jgi:hypothetical protein